MKSTRKMLETKSCLFLWQQIKHGCFTLKYMVYIQELVWEIRLDGVEFKGEDWVFFSLSLHQLMYSENLVPQSELVFKKIKSDLWFVGPVSQPSRIKVNTLVITVPWSKISQHQNAVSQFKQPVFTHGDLSIPRKPVFLTSWSFFILRIFIS